MEPEGGEVKQDDNQFQYDCSICGIHNRKE